MGWWTWARRWAAMAAAAFWLCGCVEDRSEDPAARARLAEEIALGKELEAAADHLEGRLLETQANVHLWQEMAWRHKRVSAIAVTNADQHFQSMVKLLDTQQEKARRLKRSRVASAGPLEGSAVLTRAVASRRGRRGAP